MLVALSVRVSGSDLHRHIVNQLEVLFTPLLSAAVMSIWAVNATSFTSLELSRCHVLPDYCVVLG